MCGAGKKVSGMVLDGADLEFYKYEGEMSDHLEKVRLRHTPVTDSPPRLEAIQHVSQSQSMVCPSCGDD